jgi:hypothetical protein
MIGISAFAIIGGGTIVGYSVYYGEVHTLPKEQTVADRIAAIGVGLFIAGLVGLAWQLVLWLKLW